MKNIIPFKGKEDLSIDQDVIKELEYLLKLAKKGEVVAFSGVVLSNRNTMKNIYIGNIKDNYLSFQGMINHLSIDLKDHYEE